MFTSQFIGSDTRMSQEFSGACAPTILNDRSVTQLFFHELFANPVPIFSSLCQLRGPPFLSHRSCHCHYAFVPLGWSQRDWSQQVLCRQALSEAEVKAGTELFAWWTAVLKVLLTTEKALHDLGLGLLPFSWELATTGVSGGFDPHHGIKGRCSSSMALNVLLAGV